MIIFHADDYGVNPQQAARILGCCRNGCLSSLSILPNSPHLQECMRMLDDRLLCAVHINLAEGPCCADRQEIPLLVDGNGYFKLSFAELFFASFINSRRLREQIKKECMAQITAVCRNAGAGYKLRIDSHVHYHMVPIVFRGLCDACRELEAEVDAVRWPVEPVKPLLQAGKLWREIPAVNLIKNAVLHFCAVMDYPVLVKAGWKDKTAVFFGISFTGNMGLSVVQKLLPKFAAYAARRGKNVEVLLHPGFVLDGEDMLDKKFEKFYQSPNRRAERETLLKLKKTVRK